MTDTAMLTQNLDKLYQRIVEAEQQIASGITLDLTNVPAQIEEICQQLLKLPPAQSLALVPKLEKMVTDLDAIGVKINQSDAS